MNEKSVINDKGLIKGSLLVTDLYFDGFALRAACEFIVFSFISPFVPKTDKINNKLLCWPQQILSSHKIFTQVNKYVE